MSFIRRHFVLVGLIFFFNHLLQSASTDDFPKEKLMPIVEVESPERKCYCTEVFVSSDGLANKEHSNALGLFKLSDSHFNAFKSTVYRNSNIKTLKGGLKQFWRIRGGSRAGSILLRNKSCKEICPMSCTSDWEVYKRPSYVKDSSISFKCEDDNDQNEGSADGKEN